MIINKIDISKSILPFAQQVSASEKNQSHNTKLITSPDKDIFINNIQQTIFSDSKIEEAVAFATKKHAGKYRKHPTKKIPYVTHCINVGEKLQKAGFDRNTVIAGILHDTIEDTDTTYQELEKKFGSKVSNLVREVSHSKKNASWEEKQISYLEHIQNASLEAQAISAFDKIDNMNSSIECLEDGENIFANMKATPKKQLKKWVCLQKVYDRTELPDEIKKEYRNTLKKLYILTKENNLLS